MFFLVPAYPGCPGSKAVKRSLLSIHYTAASGGIGLLKIKQLKFTPSSGEHVVMMKVKMNTDILLQERKRANQA